MSGEKRDLKDILKSLPPEAYLVFFDSEGKITAYVPDPFARAMRWEGLRVDSTAFKRLPAHERLYRLSRAFLHAAIVLCEDAAEAGPNLEWPQASVCYYCLHLATELFLKACLICVDPKPKKLNHDIPNLLRRYKEVLPDRQFHWPTMWSLSARDLKEMFGHEVLQGVDRTPDQLFRYGMDKEGRTSAGIQAFTPGYFFNYAKYLENKWSEIWTHISAHRP